MSPQSDTCTRHGSSGAVVMRAVGNSRNSPSGNVPSTAVADPIGTFASVVLLLLLLLSRPLPTALWLLLLPLLPLLVPLEKLLRAAWRLLPGMVAAADAARS